MAEKEVFFNYQNDAKTIDFFGNVMNHLFGFTVEGRQYKFFEKVIEGEVAHIFKGVSDSEMVFLKVVTDPKDNLLLDKEYEVLLGVEHPSLPVVMQKVMIEGRNAIILHEVKGIPMMELLKQYPKGIPAEHVMWMLERLLSAVGYLHASKIVHGNIKPENVMIHKKSHNVSILGFSFCIPHANSDGAKYQIINDFYTAPEVTKDARVWPASDIYSVGKLAVKLLGGDVSVGSIPETVDKRVRDFIHSMIAPVEERPHDAWKLWTSLVELRSEVYGTERFKKLD